MSLILVVDDMAIYRDPIAASLKLAGHEAIAVAGALEALALIESRRPDLILLDIGMPGIDGLALLQILRSNPSSAEIPVILLTATGERHLVLQAAKFGARDYLLKSQFKLTELLARLKKYLPGPHEPAIIPASASPAAPAAAAELHHAHDVAARVVELASSRNANMALLAELIEGDPALATRVMEAANSPPYARGVISNLPDAVRRIGCAAIRSIAASLLPIPRAAG